MKTALGLLLITTAVLVSPALSAEPSLDRARQWPQWRGPDANGVAPHANPPIEWRETKNVKWKVEIPGLGSSTPIIWGDKLFVLTAVETDQKVASVADPTDQPKRPFGIVFPNRIHQFVVMCLDRHTGKTLWQKVATEKVPHEGVHPDNDFASASPVTDGKHLFVSFGSQGLFCYDLDGNRVWERDLGEMRTRNSFGEGGSPALHDETLVTVWDHEGQSFIAALDAKTGETRWKKDRDEPSAWATPLIVDHDGRTQVITNASNRVRSYDLETGDLIWECGGQVGNVTPSPVATDDLVICLSGFRGNAGDAIPLDAKGDVSDSDTIVWQKDRGTPYIPSPLLYGHRLYYNQSNDGILTCVNAKTGETIIDRTRLQGIPRMYASPLGAADRVYLTSRDGTTLVIRNADEFEVLATNTLDDDQFDASPVAVDNDLYLRGKRYLYCLSAE